MKFDIAEIANIDEEKRNVQAKGGYHNSPLINWEIDKEINFAIKNGVLSPISMAILSNSKIELPQSKSVPFNEELKVYEDNDCYYCKLKYRPNNCGKLLGAQENPFFYPSPVGRRPELSLKPLPPSKTRYIFVYDLETGKKITDFEIEDKTLFLKQPSRHVYVDYTFECNDNVKVIRVGDRLFGNFLSLTGKMSVKDEKSGEVTTAILEIPKIKLSSSLSMRLGKDYSQSTVSDFFFTGYPDENVRREKQTVCKISFLDKELTGDYI